MTLFPISGWSRPYSDSGCDSQGPTAGLKRMFADGSRLAAGGVVFMGRLPGLEGGVGWWGCERELGVELTLSERGGRRMMFDALKRAPCRSPAVRLR
jgi:hypothetical protein